MACSTLSNILACFSRVDSSCHIGSTSAAEAASKVIVDFWDDSLGALSRTMPQQPLLPAITAPFRLWATPCCSGSASVTGRCGVLWHPAPLFLQSNALINTS